MFVGLIPILQIKQSKLGYKHRNSAFRAHIGFHRTAVDARVLDVTAPERTHKPLPAWGTVVAMMVRCQLAFQCDNRNAWQPPYLVKWVKKIDRRRGWMGETLSYTGERNPTDSIRLHQT